MTFVIFIAFVWSLGVCVHFVREAWLIARSGCEEIPECRRWWCPDGLRNRFRAKE